MKMDQNDTSRQARIDEIDSVEDARYDAMIARDFEALDRILADEFFYHRASGKASAKAEFVEDFRHGTLRFVRAERYGVRVHLYGDTATVMGSTRVVLEGAGKPLSQVSRYLNVWVLRDARWQLVARQGSTVV